MTSEPDSERPRRLRLPRTLFGRWGLTFAITFTLTTLWRAVKHHVLGGPSNAAELLDPGSIAGNVMTSAFLSLPLAIPPLHHRSFSGKATSEEDVVVRREGSRALLVLLGVVLAGGLVSFFA